MTRTSYTIKDVKVAGGQTTLGFGDVLFTIGMGNVAKVDNAAKSVESAETLAGYGRTDYGRHQGRWLYNEDKSRGFRIAAVEGNAFKLEGVEGDLEGIFKDLDGDGRRLYWISDIGPGDTCRIPAATYVSRAGPGVYELQAMTEVQMTVPKGR